jgi:transposase
MVPHTAARHRGLSCVTGAVAGLAQTQLVDDPFSGQLFVFRGKGGDRIKVLWWDGDGLCLYAQRL